MIFSQVYKKKLLHRKSLIYFSQQSAEPAETQATENGNNENLRDDLSSEYNVALK